MTKVETHEETWCEAEIHRVAGEITRMSPEPDIARGPKPISNMRSALHVSSRQNPGNCAPRSAWRVCGVIRGAAASSRTARSVYGWFTEGFYTLDLKDAKALLDELS